MTVQCKCHHHKCTVEIEGEPSFKGVIPPDCILGYPLFPNFKELKEETNDSRTM